MNKLALSFLVISTVFFSCGKEEIKDIIPGYPIFKVDLNYQDTELRTPGNIKTFTSPRLAGESVGYSGLIVVCALEQDNGTPILYAFDLCCPQEKQKEIKVIPNNKDGKATCPKCKSVFNLYSITGNQISGPANTGLQRYRVRKEANNTVFHIFR